MACSPASPPARSCASMPASFPTPPIPRSCSTAWACVLPPPRAAAASPAGSAARPSPSRSDANPGLDCGALARLPGAASAHEEEPGRYVLEAGDPAALLAALTAYLRDQGVTLSELRVGHGSLEDTFLRLTGEE